MTTATLDDAVAAARATLDAIRGKPVAALPQAADAAPSVRAPPPPSGPDLLPSHAARREAARLEANNLARPLGEARDEPWRAYVQADGFISPSVGLGGTYWGPI
jgi:hypothetical protein